MKFERKKVISPEGLATWYYTEVTQDPSLHDFMLIVDQQGVRFTGRSSVIFDMDDLQAFAQQMSDCWTEHMKLKPRLVSTLSGH